MERTQTAGAWLPISTGQYVDMRGGSPSQREGGTPSSRSVWRPSLWGSGFYMQGCPRPHLWLRWMAISLSSQPVRVSTASGGSAVHSQSGMDTNALAMALHESFWEHCLTRTSPTGEVQAMASL